jgi:hypothetical protein
LSENTYTKWDHIDIGALMDSCLILFYLAVRSCLC